jgi:hypothetical protein
VKGRYRAITPVTDYSITQKIRTALIEDGHTDLAIEQITQPISELEAAHALLLNRVVALEQEKVKWQTESGVYRILDKKVQKTAFNWMKIATRGLVLSLGALFLWGIEVVVKLAWKGLTT